MVRERRESLPNDVQALIDELLHLASRTGISESKIASSEQLIELARRDRPGSTIPLLVSDVQELVSRTVVAFDNERDRLLLTAGLNIGGHMLETSTRSRILRVWAAWSASSPGYLTDDGALERFRNVLIHRLAWKLSGRRTWNPALTDLDLAQRYLNQGRYLESERLLLRIIGDLDVAPSDRVKAFMTLSSSHASNLRFDVAVKDIKDLLPLTNALEEEGVILELIRQIDRLAGRLTHEEYYSKASQLAKEALIYLPSSGRLWRRLGCIEWYSNDLVDALAAFDAAILNGENRGHVLHERGQVLAQMGRYSQAIMELNEALQQPRSSDSRSFATSARAYAIGMQGELDNALEDFAEAESLTPGNAWLFYLRGLCYLKYDMPSNAIEDLQKSLKLQFPRLTKHMRLDAERALSALEAS